MELLSGHGLHDFSQDDYTLTSVIDSGGRHSGLQTSVSFRLVHDPHNENRRGMGEFG
jgi:hypothetical protein